MKILRKAQWSPYVAGTMLGLVSWFSVLTAGKYLGVSTTFVRTIGMIESIFTPERVASLPYFVKEKPIIDWQPLALQAKVDWMPSGEESLGCLWEPGFLQKSIRSFKTTY